MKTLEQLVRPNIRALKPYSTARDEYAGGEITTWLDANENPYENGVNRYPAPHQKELKRRIAEDNFRDDLIYHHERLDRLSGSARALCRKHPTPENAVRLCDILDGLCREDPARAALQSSSVMRPFSTSRSRAFSMPALARSRASMRWSFRVTV